MVIGDPISPELLGRRGNGALVEWESPGRHVWNTAATLTKLGARHRWRTYLTRFAEDPRAIVYRVEGNRVVARHPMLIPDDGQSSGPPDAGVREPQRPSPSAGGATTAAAPDE